MSAETDLYPPIKSYLEGQGYTVKGEIEGCDVVARRDEEEPVVVELKRTLGLPLLLQAVDRLPITPWVYLAVPAACSPLKRDRKRTVRLIRTLGLGLIAVHEEVAGGLVEVLADPSTYRPRKNPRKRQRLLGEFQQRVGDPTAGGTDNRRGRMTAYRQRSLRIARYLASKGPTKAATIRDALEEPKALAILYRNVYSWFERVDRGIYQLSPRGEKELPHWPDRPV